MTIEVLFARAGQGQTFLRLAVCGLAAGALLQACLWLGGHFPALTALWDALAVGLSAALTLPALLLSGDGVRAYGVLGLVIGAVLYAAGIRYLVGSVARCVKKHRKPGAQKQEETGGAGNL